MKLFGKMFKKAHAEGAEGDGEGIGKGGGGAGLNRLS